MARKKGGWRSLLGLGGDVGVEARGAPSSEGGVKPVLNPTPTEAPPSTAFTGQNPPGGGAGASTRGDAEPARNEPVADEETTGGAGDEPSAAAEPTAPAVEAAGEQLAA